MKRISVAVAALCVVCVAGQCLTSARSAHAYPSFAKAFEKKYVGDRSSEVQKSIAKQLMHVKCFVCHDPRPGDNGKVSKKNRNPYGQAVNKLLTKKDQKDEAKALRALDEVAKEKAEGAEKTFGEQLAAGKLPFLYEGFDYGGERSDERD